MGLRGILGLGVAALALLLLLVDARAGDYYLEIEGIRGDSKAPGHLGWIEVLEWNFNVKAPFDPSHQSATGRRTHKPLVVVSKIDSALPLLVQASESKRKLSTVRLEAARRDQEGVLLRNATITRIREVKQGNQRMEEITFEYEGAEPVAPSGPAPPKAAPAH